MASESRARDEQVWVQIERDKRIDRWLRRICVAAWAVTIVLTLALAAVQGLRFAQFMSPGFFGWSILASYIFPLLIVLGVLSTLIATLATVGIFLRLRTASLHEIQLRLAALEEMLTRDEGRGDHRSR
jgi:hypothetical protein